MRGGLRSDHLLSGVMHMNDLFSLEQKEIILTGAAGFLVFISQRHCLEPVQERFSSR